MRITNTMLILLLSGMAFSQTQTQSQEATNETSESKKVQTSKVNNAATVRKAPVRVKKVEATEQTTPKKKAANVNTSQSGGK